MLGGQPGATGPASIVLPKHLTGISHTAGKWLMRCAAGCHRVTRWLGHTTYKGARSDVVCYGVAAIGEPSKQAVEGSSPFSRSSSSRFFRGCQCRVIHALVLGISTDRLPCR